MNIHVTLLVVVLSFVRCDRPCSREDSRLIREYFTQVLIPIYERNQLSIPSECIFYAGRDRFYQQELHKARLGEDHWLCQYCNQTFTSESHLDSHLSHQHNESVILTDQSVCLADYCSIFRCDVLRRSKRRSHLHRQRMKQILNEQQLTLLRTRCASLINQCIPANLHQPVKVQMQHDMYAEICAYLTSHHYFELPTDRKPLINLTALFSLSIAIGMCLIGIHLMRRRRREQEEDESDKHLSEESISTATALLAKSPANGIIHSTRSPLATIRHRVRFQSLEEKLSSTSPSEPT